MRSLSSEFITSELSYQARLQLPDGTNLGGDIVQLSVTSTLNGSTECLTLGASSAATLSCTIDSPGNVLRDTKVRLYIIGRTVDGVLEEIPFGVYTITEAKDNEGTVELTGYDAMATDMEMGYFPSGSPGTAKAVLTDLCAQAGVELVVPADVADVTVSAASGYTRREMIGYMAALLGCSACMDDTGRLALRWFTPSGLTVDGDTIYSGGLELADSDWTLGKIECSVTTSTTTEDEDGTITNTTENTETLTAGDGMTGLAFSNPWMTQSVLDSLYARVGGLSYRGGTVPLFGDLRHEVGDIITVVDYSGVSHTVPIMQITWEYDGGLKTTIAAYAQSETESSVSASGPLTQAMERYAAELALFKNMTADNVTATNAKIKNLRAENAEIQTAIIGKADITDLNATNAEIQNLSTKYANIDFSNIGEAAIEQFYAKSGVIQDVVISDGQITGRLVGVTIVGDLIEGGTVVADKIVIKGEDGLYYKLNTDGVTTEAEQTDYNSINGSIITAKSITATKIAVDDLVAFDATIGGFNITEDALYSGVKGSVDNTTRGVYLDSAGQLAFGDANNFIKYYKDFDGTYKLEISASSVTFQVNDKPIEEIAADAIVSSVEEFYQSTSPIVLEGGAWSAEQPVWTEGTYIWRRTAVTYGDGSSEYTPSASGVCITGNTGQKGDDAILLQILSSNGNMFKNSALSTTLTVEITVGGVRLTSSRDMYTYFGGNAHLVWQQKKYGETEFSAIDVSDPRISDNGFIFTIDTEDVTLQTVYNCILNY